MKVEDQNEGYKEIPGLPEPDRGGKKGKKKNNSKKTLNLPIFTEANGKVPGPAPPVLSVEERPVKPQLNDKEVAILDSCHSYIHDYLKISGPMNAFDSRLQAEINLFPPEAKSVITRVGGLKAFILLCENLIVVDKIVGAKVHTTKIKELALKDVYNSIPSSDKTIWNSTSPNSKVNKDQIAVNKPPVGHNSSESAIQYHSTPQHFGNIGERGPPPPPQNHIGASGSRAINSDLSLQGYPPMESAVEGLQKEVFKLNNQNKELISKLADKDKQIIELRVSEGRITQLELETDQARIQINKYREQIERLKSELTEAQTRAQSIIGQQPDKHKSYSDNDRDLIISLQKQLDSEKLRNLNLTQNQVDSQLPGLSLSGQHNPDNKQNVFAPMNNSLNRQNSFVNLGQVESDPLGLRNMSFSSGVGGGLELKSTPNLFGAIGSAFGKQQRGKVDSVMAPPGGLTQNHQLQAPPGTSLAAPGSSSFNLMKSASASTIGMSGSRGPSPSTNYQGFPSGLGGMPFSSFSSGHHQPLMPGQGLMGGQNLIPGQNLTLGQSLAPGSGQSLAGSLGQQPISSSVQSLVTGSQSLSVGNLSLGGMSGVPQQSQWSGGLLGSSSQQLEAPGAAPGLGGFLSQAPGLGSSLAPGGGHNSFGLSHLGSHQVSGVGDLGQDIQPQKSNSAIRQEQLIKKLVNTIPGSDDETIKHYIQVLRDRHGKLSGWSTNQITQEIIQLVQESTKPN